MTESALRRTAVVLAAVAVVAVLAAAGLAGQRYAARDTAADPDPTTRPTPSPSVEVPSPTALPTPSAFAGGSLVFGFAQRDAVFEVPRGWEAYRGYYGLEVGDDYVGVYPQAYDPARYGDGWCAKDETETRAYVGWGPTVTSLGTDVATANRGVLAAWDTGYHYKVNRRYYFPPRTEPQRRVRLDDGTTAWLSSMTGAIHDKKCPTLTASQVTVLSFANPVADSADGRITHVIGYRNVGTGRDVTQAEIVRILETARVVDQ